MLWLVPQSAPARDVPSGIEMARQINQAFIDVAEKSLASVVINPGRDKPDTRN